MTRFAPILAALWLASACGSTESEPCDLCGDPASSRLRALEDTTWLVSRVTFAEAVPGAELEVGPGIDLDGISSGRGSGDGATCEERKGDYQSELDPELRGVDAAGEQLIELGEQVVAEGRTFQGDLDRAMAEGRIRWAIRVGPIDPADERRIELELYEVTDPVAVGTDGRPTPGQALRGHRLLSADGYVRGSVAVGFGETTALGVDGEVMLLPFHDLRVGGLAIAATSVDGVLAANLGGSFSVDALVDVTARDSAGFGPGDEVVVRDLYELVADIEPSDAEPRVCARVSVGFGLEAVPMTLVVE